MEKAFGRSVVSGALHGTAAWSAYALLEFAFASVLFRLSRPHAVFSTWHWKLTAMLFLGYLIAGPSAVRWPARQRGYCVEEYEFPSRRPPPYAGPRIRTACRGERRSQPVLAACGRRRVRRVTSDSAVERSGRMADQLLDRLRPAVGHRAAARAAGDGSRRPVGRSSGRGYACYLRHFCWEPLRPPYFSEGSSSCRPLRSAMAAIGGAALLLVTSYALGRPAPTSVEAASPLPSRERTVRTSC